MRVTILVPVYGVEKYIAECAHSLFKQTYQNIEYVFCDDCTKDKSIDVLREVLEEYPERKNNVHIIKNNGNKGSGRTRQHLISEVKTECFAFVDSDDILQENAIEQLVNKMKETDTDIVDGAFCYYNDGKKWNVNLPSHDELGIYIKKVQVGNLVSHQLWGRLYKSTVLEKLPEMFFEGVDKAEDYCVTTRLVSLISRSWIDDVVYLYRFEGQTTFNKDRVTRDAISYLKATKIVYDFYRKRNNVSLPVEIGILRAYRQCYRQTGMTMKMVDEIVEYKPERLITKILLRVLHSSLLPKSVKEIIYKVIRSYAIR